MVNLDKLIDTKETCNKFTLETNEQLTTNNDEIHSKQQHDSPNSPKQQSFDDHNSPSSLNEDELEDDELNNLNENQESSLNNNNNNFNNDTEYDNDLNELKNNEELTNNQEQSIIDTGLIENPEDDDDDDDDEPNLEICDENDENLSKSDFDDKNQSSNLPLHLNGIKKEINSFYYLNLKCPNNSQLNIIFDQLRNMYIEQQLLDCTLVCENQCIKAHKLILAAVSPYFRSIFYSFNSLGCNNTAVMLQNIPARDMRLIIKILYSINDYNNPLKLSLNRAISLRKSVYRLKIDFINDHLDQCGVPQLNEKFIDNLNNENELFNLDLSKNNRKRKRSFCDENLNSNKINSIENLQDKQSCSDSADDVSSECSTTMKHHKFKHKYLLSDEHLEQNDKLVKCGNDILERQQYLEDEMIDDDNYDQQIDDDIEDENNTNLNINNSIKSDLQNENDRKLNENNDKQLKSNSLNQNTQQNDFNEKIIDFSTAKNSNQDDLIKLMNSSINNENADKVANLYKAMKKLCSANSESMNNDNLNQINKSQNFANDILNSTFSQLCMAGSNLNNLSGLNSDTARALLFTNELLKNNTNNQLHHSKNSADNSLNTSTSSTTSSSTNNNGNSQANNTATAALVAAAQQHILNASFLNKNSNKQNSNVLLNSNSKSNGLSSSNNYSSLQNGLSSGNNSTGMQPVKRGRGRPPRHTQPNGSESGSINEELPLNKSQHTKLQQSIKQQLSSNTSSLNNINNLSNLTGLSNSSTNSIANSLSVLTQQHKKWRPNLENLLALKIGKNKLNSSSPTNDLNSQLQTTQANLLKNDLINKNLSSSASSNNNSGISNHYSQNGGSPSLNNNNNTTTSSTTNSSVNNLNGNSANSNNNNAEGKNTCLYCPQVYYSTQAMNDHINNVHTKTAFKYICEFCSKEFSWKISLTKHLKHAHGELNTFGPRSLGLSVQNLNGLTSAISNHLNAANSLTNQELLHSFMNQRDNESAMLNFGAIGD